MWYLHCVLKYCTFVIYACALFRTPYFKVQRQFEVILSLLTHWQEIQRDIATKTRYKCITIRRSRLMRILRVYERKGCEMHTDYSMPPSIGQVKREVFTGRNYLIPQMETKRKYVKTWRKHYVQHMFPSADT